MTKQREALRLAALIEMTIAPQFHQHKAAAELRRLHEINQELLEALTSIAKNSCCGKCQEAALVARAAIAKAGEQP